MVTRFRKRALRKTVLREIRDSLGRYLAIVGIIALGSGLFTGLKVTNTAMIYTCDRYLRDTDFFDVRLLSTLGFDKETPERLADADGSAPRRARSPSTFWLSRETGRSCTMPSR